MPSNPRGQSAACAIAAGIIPLTMFWHAPLEFIVHHADHLYFWIILISLLCVAVVEYRSYTGDENGFFEATDSAVEHREECVEALRQQWVRENRIRHVGSQ
jgi:hypothetical protein